MSSLPNADHTPPWPPVPACYGWLSLDRRGNWRLKDEPVLHDGLNRFIGQRYTPQTDGCWIVRNGPQKVFVTLAYLPWVLRTQPGGRLLTHTGLEIGAINAVFLDDEGNLLCDTPIGPGLVDDRDLAALLSECTTHDDRRASDEALLAALQGTVSLYWRGHRLSLIRRADVPARFGFQPQPQPPERDDAAR
ncbi:MAG: DUF2946 family protein [Rhodocyclaceae bacterium]